MILSIYYNLILTCRLIRLIRLLRFLLHVAHGSYLSAQYFSTREQILIRNLSRVILKNRIYSNLTNF